ncbi:hypothetical protein [Salmonella phage 7-11]|uniref:Tail fiber protein n=1 Tax=Salmonella phage 7-11 TaxID=1054968 RepID=G0X4U6_9CAUD|nr:hypothetical protein SaPh711_gp013 [Salmonella phage 7-11]AEK81928.1 hypothetical protein [Salmonella phage 7-11]
MSLLLSGAPSQPAAFESTLNDDAAILQGAQPNVGLFAWTTNDLTSVKDIITYVQTALEAANSAQASAIAADASRQEVLAIKLQYDQIVVQIDQQYSDMVNLANSISVDTTQIQQYVTQAQNIKTSVDASYQQVSLWRDEIQQYQMMAVYQYRDRTITGTTVEIGPLAGSVQRLTLNSSTTTVTIGSFSDGPDKARQLTLLIKQGTGSNKVVWPSSIRWNNNRAPVLSYLTGRVDVITLLTYNSGASWYGFYNGGWFDA